MPGGGGPFNCTDCTDKDKRSRNCFNALNLSEGAAAVISYTDEITKEHKVKGAVKVASLGGIRLYECPVSHISAETRELMRLCFLIEETGSLLYRGGWSGQPYWLIEAYELYKCEAARHQREKNDG